MRKYFKIGYRDDDRERQPAWDGEICYFDGQDWISVDTRYLGMGSPRTWSGEVMKGYYRQPLSEIEALELVLLGVIRQ